MTLEADILQTRARWRRRLLAFALGTVAALLSVYVGLNLLVINFVPLLHHFSFHVVVVDGATATPVSGATVGWHHTNARSGHQWVTPIGATDGNGELTFEKMIQEQPLWAWPAIGVFRFGLIFHVAAPGYEEQRVRLWEALPRVPYSRPEGVVRVVLVPDE